MLWFAPENRRERRASVQTARGWIDLTASGMTPPSGPLAASQTLHEPDPAVIRAGALAELTDRYAADAERLSASAWAQRPRGQRLAENLMQMMSPLL